MKIIELSDSGVISERHSQQLGDEYSLFEKIQQMGVGSPKLLYRSGLIAFDTIKEDNQDINYTNIELFKRGLAIRFKKRNKFLAALLPTDEIQGITFETFKIKVTYRNKEQVRLAAHVKINLEKETILFSISPLEYNRAKSFFSKPYFSKLSEFTESGLPPEADIDKEWRNILIHLIEKIT